MTATLGYLTLLLSFFLGLYIIILSCINLFLFQNKIQKSILRAFYAISALLSIAIIITLYQLLILNFHFVYVSQVIDQTTPIFLRLSALWAKQDGSLLFWVWLMSLSVTFYLSKNKITKHRKQALINLIFILPNLLFLFILVRDQNPFYVYWQDAAGEIWISVFSAENWQPFYPDDGIGLNPILHHFGMIFHPPMLYLGFISLLIPTTIISVEVIWNKFSGNTIKKLFPWFLFAWTFLSAGIILGSRWAYDLLSWGGYWSWDAVETASLLPWLTLTALIHELSFYKRKKQHFHRIVFLSMLSFFFVVFEVFTTRSGIIESVHAFAKSQDSSIFLIFLIIVTIWCIITLMMSFKNKPEISIPFLDNENKKLLALSNIELFLYASFCFIGIIFPLIQNVFFNRNVFVTSNYFQKGTLVFGILFLLTSLIYLIQEIKNKKTSILLIISMGIISFFLPYTTSIRLIFWLITSITGLISIITFKNFSNLQNTKKIKRIGNFLIHIAFIMLSIGVLGMEKLSYEKIYPVNHRVAIEKTSFSFEVEEITQQKIGDELITKTPISIYHNQKTVTSLTPIQSFNMETNQSTTIPDAYNSFWYDISFSIVGYDEELQSLLILVQFNQFPNFIWFSGFTAILGAIIIGLNPKIQKTKAKK